MTPVAAATYSPDIAAALAAGVIDRDLAQRFAALEVGITQYRAVVDQAAAHATEKETDMGWFKGPEEKAAQKRLDDAHDDGTPRTRAEAEKLSDDVYDARVRDREARRAGRH